jgi:tetratricopeptide (TPR) repeat protein/predicted Ser/Thr protein kinase
MEPGDVIAGRFRVEALAASGGMGRVYRARDEGGAPVAVKVLFDADDEARFEREARVLSTLRHPGIVGYVAHGRTARGEAYLVTEWLDGETLAERLERGPLGIAETVDLGRAVAEALAAAHREGIVHRDVKPGNLLLPSGRAGDARIIDFGIARAAGHEAALTMTGAIVGTAGYIAPEQARGERDLDARADVFSLGCVLFRCLTGRPAFAGDEALAILLKLVMEEPARAIDLAPEIPEALDGLVMRMLAKARDERPRDAGAVAAELAEIAAGLAAPHAARPRTETRGITALERRVMSLVLARGVRPQQEGERTVVLDEAQSGEFAVPAAAARYKGRLTMLADGSMMIALASAGAATDLAAQAARCALSIRHTLSVPIAVVSGRGVISPSLPVGELIDRAVALASAGAPQTIHLDEATAALLGPELDVRRDGADLVLEGERDLSEATPRLLGRPTTYVGRERELALLEATFAESASDWVARAVLVTGEPGMGKSRLRHELLRRLGERAEDLEVWMGRGDPVSEGSAFGMLAQALRRTAGIVEGEPFAARRDKLAARVGRRVPAAEAPRVAAFLGEILGWSAEGGQAEGDLAAARRDPLLLGEQMRRAFEAFLLAECAAHPVVIVLDDLHWGDLPTVTFVGAALRSLRDHPLFVLALARPEVHKVFPRLWADTNLQQIHLTKLTRRASERLARQVLGDGATAEVLAALVDRADGNAFYLEEMIRAAVERRGDALPETVVAMVQSRLEALAPEARRALRAASVFGDTFWRGGVVAVLSDPEAAAPLAVLAERELVSPPREGKFPGEAEHAFRHALVREAAYAMLTDDDRVRAHRRAAAWLEARGESDDVALAHHFELGGVPARAAVFWARSAEQALRGNDLAAAVERADRGLAGGAEGALRASLQMILLEAYAWRNEWPATAAHAEEVFHREAQGSRPWCMAAMGRLWSSSVLGRYDVLLDTIQALGAAPAVEGAEGALVQALCAVVMTMTLAGMHDAAAIYLARLEEIGGRGADPVVRGWTELGRGFRLRYVAGDASRSLARMRAGAASFAEAGAPQQRLWLEVHAAVDLWHLGAHDAAADAVEGALREPPSGSRLRLVASVGKYVLANVLLDQGRVDEARDQVLPMIETERAQQNRFQEGIGRATLAQILARRGDLDAAAAEALAAVDALAPCPGDQAMARAVLASIRLAQGQAEGALALAREAMGGAAHVPVYLGGLIRAAHVEALLAAEGAAAARRAAAEALAWLRDRAAGIEDPALRESFLDRVPQNARIAALAKEIG